MPSTVCVYFSFILSAANVKSICAALPTSIPQLFVSCRPIPREVRHQAEALVSLIKNALAEFSSSESESRTCCSWRTFFLSKLFVFTHVVFFNILLSALTPPPPHSQIHVSHSYRSSTHPTQPVHSSQPTHHSLDPSHRLSTHPTQLTHSSQPLAHVVPLFPLTSLRSSTHSTHSTTHRVPTHPIQITSLLTTSLIRAFICWTRDLPAHRPTSFHSHSPTLTTSVPPIRCDLHGQWKQNDFPCHGAAREGCSETTWPFF